MHTFEITITSQENFTWQGLLRTSDGVQHSFRSELELLLLLGQLLKEGA